MTWINLSNKKQTYFYLSISFVSSEFGEGYFVCLSQIIEQHQFAYLGEFGSSESDQKCVYLIYISIFSLFQGDTEEKFSIFVHSRPGFLFNRVTTRSAYFLDRQVNNSIQVYFL